MPVSAGTGQFLDNDSYEEVEVGPEVPETADFGVRINGDSMMPRYLDKQIVWIQKTDELNDGEIGIFYYNGNAYSIRAIILSLEWPDLSVLTL